MVASPETLILLSLHAVAAAALVWALVRARHQPARASESGRPRRLSRAEIAAGAAALAATLGFVLNQ
jgi:hypothetical protein